MGKSVRRVNLGGLDMATDNGFMPSVWDRLMEPDESADACIPAPAMTSDQLKASVGHDLEALLNTRVALEEEDLSQFPLCRKSVLNYGLRDFASMCLTSSEDRKIICDALVAAIRRYEPRLGNVRAEVVVAAGRVPNRLDFIILGTLDLPAGTGRVEFNARLQPSTLRYSISESTRPATVARSAS
jgi:type VI secretion system protein ImpF